MLQFDVVTLFPKMFDAITESGITGRAREKLVYQFLPYGDDPEVCEAHTRLLVPVPAAGRPPAAKAQEIGFDETFEALKVWADIGIVFDQDYINLPDIQRGLRAAAGSGHAYATMARYQESRIFHFHEVIDRKINGG